MIVLAFLFALLWDRAPGWGFKDGVLHNSIWLVAGDGLFDWNNGPVKFFHLNLLPIHLCLDYVCINVQQISLSGHNPIQRSSADAVTMQPQERAAGVYHREGRTGKYQLTYVEAKAVCEYEGGQLATLQQLEAARKIGFHMCAAGWMAKGRVGYPIVKPGSNCGFGKTGIVDYGFRLNRSEKWDAYCYNPNGKDCGGIFTDSKHIFKTPGYPNEYEDDQICYWHIRVKYGQRIQIQFLDFDLEDDTACMADYLEIYDSYDDVNGFVGRYCGDELPENIISTGNVMTLKFLSDASVTAGGFRIKYIALDPAKKSEGKNATTQDNTNYLAGRYGI